MAGTIKGIIVEIGGDTSGLQRALSKVNSATSSLSRELRGINSLLKLDPKNTELLSQKQTVLNKEIEATSNKIKQLKEIQNEAIKAEINGKKISEENWRAIQREIINTENKLKNLTLIDDPFYKMGQRAEDLGNKISSISSRIDNLGNKLTVGVTVPVVAGFTAMTKSAIENETAVQQVEKIYGEASKNIKDFAENKAIDYNMSASEAYKYSQIYGNLIQTITDDQNENAENTQSLLKASAVIASSTGRTMEDVMDRIRSGLLGNTEAIEDLGVNVNVALLESTDAFKQFAGDKSWNELDFQTQQQIRLFGILEQTTKKYGDEVNQNTASSIQQLTAKTKNLTNNLGKKLLPIAEDLIDNADNLVNKFGELSEEEQENIVKIGLIVAAAGPLLKIVGTLGKTVGTTSKGIGIFAEAVGVARNKTTSTVPVVNNLAKVISGLTSPAGIAALGITTAVGIIVTQIKKAEEESKKSLSNIGQSASDFITGINSAESHLSGFNSTLFATSEEQQKLQENMNAIQEGITEICKKASDERRGYTQEEITQLDEYFKKLRELKNREVEIQQSIADAISQQAITNAQTFQGSLDEYKVQSQEWIKTAEEQKDETLRIIKEGTTQQIALLNQQYSTEESRRSEAYQKEYDDIMQQQQQKIDLANQEVAKVSEAYANGYIERSTQENGFLVKLQEYQTKQQELQTNHNEQIRKLKNNELWYVTDTASAIRSENETFAFHQKDIWNQMYKDMNESQEKQLGVWLAQVAQTEMYGGEINEETKQIVDSIIASYDSMPKETQEAMKNAMSPMLDEMEKKEPSLFAKASGIADGILSRLKKSFDIHSPSRETRDIFQNVMKGAELGLEDEKKKLNNQIDTIANGIKGRFEKLIPNMGNIKQSVIDQTRTIYTTPNIIFNVQELDEDKLKQCFNYINKKFGTQY